MARTRKGKPRKISHKELVASLKILPAVAALPQDFTEEQKVWWNKFIGKTFKGKIGPRGKKSSNARTWTQGKFVRDFCDDFYPRLTEDERKQYYIIIGPKVYSYLTNHSTRGSAGIAIKPKHVKQRVYAHDIWRCENPETFKYALETYMAEHKIAKLNVGTRRSVTSKLFQRLPAEEQEEYKRKARNQLRSIKPSGRLEGEAKARYIADFMDELKALLKEAERYGMGVATQFITEDLDGNLNMTMLTTDNLQGFQKSSAAAQMANGFKKHVEGETGKEVRGVPPAVTVYPDYTQDMRPNLPEYNGMRLDELQELFERYFNLTWTFQGGSGEVPWELISASPDDWISPRRRPPNAIIKEPKSLSKTTIRSWFDYITRCQNGNIPLDKQFQFCRVIAGQPPIAKSLSQESSRRLEFVQAYGKEVLFLEFTDTVTSCHAPDGMKYPESSIQYARFWSSYNTSSSNSDLPTNQHDPPVEIDSQDSSPNLPCLDCKISEKDNQTAQENSDGDSDDQGLEDDERMDRDSDESDEDEVEDKLQESDNDAETDELEDDRCGSQCDDLSEMDCNGEQAPNEYDKPSSQESMAATCSQEPQHVPLISVPAHENVFGQFLSLPLAPEPTPPKSYGAIYSHLQSTLKQSTDVLKEWHALGSEHLALQNGDHEAAQNAVAPLNLPTVWCPLMEFLVIRRIAWKRAEEIAPSVFDIDLRMRLAAREALRVADIATRNYEVTTVMNNPQGDDLDGLAELLVQTRTAIAELQWCHSELQTLEELSTKMKTKLGDAWLHDDFPNNLHTLRNIAVELSQWTNAAYHLDRRLRRNRPTLWGTTKLPFEEICLKSPVWYWFGNPQLTELPQGLQSSLISALNLGDNAPELECRIDHWVARTDRKNSVSEESMSATSSMASCSTGKETFIRRT